MNSCLYRCTVMHHRLEPVPHRFHYSVFMFCFDLDELDTLQRTLSIFSHNRWNIFSLRDKDHLNYNRGSIKKNLLHYLSEQGVTREIGKVKLITNVRTFGYVFNPVSFYFCFDKDGNPVCAVPEVGNTFGELKPFLLGEESHTAAGFSARRVKHFYVSPFIDLDAEFEFNLSVPGDRIQITIDDWKEGKKFFKSSLTGERKPLSNRMLWWYMLRFPLITVQVIGLIHWQALRLYMKKLSFHRKHEHPELQQGVI